MSAILPGHGLPPTGLGGINLQPQGNVQVPQGQQQAGSPRFQCNK